MINNILIIFSLASLPGWLIGYCWWWNIFHEKLPLEN